jgi:transcriptional regulator with XRE-family HTH domain
MEKHLLDTIDSAVLGARLQEARRARGFTQQAVADEMEMARTTLVAIEKGERRVTPHELLRLAAMYGPAPVASQVPSPPTNSHHFILTEPGHLHSIPTTASRSSRWSCL